MALVVAQVSAVDFQIDPWGDNSLRVRIAPPKKKIVDQDNMPLTAVPPPLTTKVTYEEGEVYTVTNGNLVVEVSKEGLLTATRQSDKTVLLKQTSLKFDAPHTKGTMADAYSVTATFEGHGRAARLYGFGEHRTGRVNSVPFTHEFAHSHLYQYSHGSDVFIPWYCCSTGYGFIWNSPAYGSVNVTSDAIEWYAWSARNFDVWITTHKADPISKGSLKEILGYYADAIGHSVTMPYYATGFIQCKNRYRNQTQLMDVARGYVDRGLPVSVIVIDYHHWTHQGDWAFNGTCWPDPQAMVDELATFGIELMVSFWPFQTTDSKNWLNFVSNGWLVDHLSGTPAPFDGSQYLYDAMDPHARNATYGAFMDGYGKYGIRTLWLDASEPERFDEADVGNWAYHAGSDGEVGEAWVVDHVRTFADGMAKRGIRPEDYFVLARNAWPGTWQNSAALWSGDIESTFRELDIQVRVAQGVAMSGVTLWTTDIGGYANGDPSDPEFQELIVRWFQFGAFCPLFRLHGARKGGPPKDPVCGETNGDNEVWNLAPNQTHYDAITTVMHLRETLRPYVSKINAIAVATGVPMVRPMMLEFPDDNVCAGPLVEDQFMFGPTWLVAPVTTYGQRVRSVYLPDVSVTGDTWVYFYSGKEHAGKQRIEIAAPIGEFPLFYRRKSEPGLAYDA